MRFCTLFIIVFEEYLVKHAQICKKKKMLRSAARFLKGQVTSQVRRLFKF